MLGNGLSLHFTRNEISFGYKLNSTNCQCGHRFLVHYLAHLTHIDVVHLVHLVALELDVSRAHVSYGDST